MLTGVRNFLQRVQQGHVLRWVLGYFAASWFVYQVISLLVHNLELLTIILKISTVMLVVGWLIAAVLAYFQGARSLPQITDFEALLWQYSGVSVAAGQAVTLFAEGRVHLAVERLLEAAQHDQVSTYEWLSPAGEPTSRADLGRARREQCLLNRQFSFGSLLMAVAPAERLTPAESRAMVPNVSLFSVPGATTITVPRSGNRHFAVNDVYIDDRGCDPQLYDNHVDPRVFFGDNLGFFSVQLQVR